MRHLIGNVCLNLTYLIIGRIYSLLSVLNEHAWLRQITYPKLFYQDKELAG